MGEVKGRSRLIYSGGALWASVGLVSCSATSFTRARREGSLVHVAFMWSAIAANGGQRWYVASDMNLPPMKLPPTGLSNVYIPTGHVSWHDGSNYYAMHMLYKPDENVFFFGTATGAPTQIPVTSSIPANGTVAGEFTYQAA